MYIDFSVMFGWIYNMIFDTGSHTLLFTATAILINWHILKISIYPIPLMLYYLMLNVCSILGNDTILFLKCELLPNICNGAECNMFKKLLSMLCLNCLLYHTFLLYDIATYFYLYGYPC